MLKTLLSTFEGTQLWNNVTSAIPQFEKLVETLVKNMQEENGESENAAFISLSCNQSS